MQIRRYAQADEAALFDLLRAEGDDWSCYFAEDAIGRYRRALLSSVTYAAFEDGALIGFARCREDDGFGIYVYDLLVDKAFRGRGIGRALMERVRADYHPQTTYVMSDADAYYEKQGCRREGSIFEVGPSGG
jgi:ribosomal protein S18 acetylase RimI-like enzyme